MKKTKSCIILSLLILGLTNSCNLNNPVNRLVDSKISNPNQFSSGTTLKGQVEFPAKFAIKATVPDIAFNATVSLINPSTNTSIASGVTENNGAFVINPSVTFNPSSGDTFILEASRRLGDVGNTLITLRTVVRRTANHTWDSITTSEIKINSLTTALTVIRGLNPVTIDVEDLIGALDNTQDPIDFIPFGNVDDEILNKVTELVLRILDQNEDPIRHITLNNSNYEIFNPPDVTPPSLTPDTRILFRSTSNTTGLQDLFVVDTSNSNITGITSLNSFTIEQIALSPDRSRVAYKAYFFGPPDPIMGFPTDYQQLYYSSTVSPGQTLLYDDFIDEPNWVSNSRVMFVATAPTSYNDIFAVDYTGGTVQNVTNESTGFDQIIKLSTDGTKVAFERNVQEGTDAGNNILFTINPEGSGINEIFRDSRQIQNIAWTNDNTKILFTLNNSVNGLIKLLKFINKNGSGVATISDISWSTAPVWSPDGTKIAANKNNKLTIFNINGSVAGTVSEITWDGDFKPQWAPNGSKIYFQALSGGSYEIFSVNPDGSGLDNLTETSGVFEEGIQLSKDGSKIAFSKNGDIFVMDTSGGTIANITNDGSGTNDYYPLWLP